MALLVVVATFVYFVPTLLSFRNAAELPAESVAASVLWWVRLNWVRAVVYRAAWFLALRAFSYGATSRCERLTRPMILRRPRQRATDH